MISAENYTAFVFQRKHFQLQEEDEKSATLKQWPFLLTSAREPLPLFQFIQILKEYRSTQMETIYNPAPPKPTPSQKIPIKTDKTSQQFTIDTTLW